ncbi:MAG: hypothetical protein ACE5R4_07425 [Armatimonadota bacterium]
MPEACFQCVLTVAESKRLIAKGVASMAEVQRAMQEGMVAVGTGSTNAYLLEELLGRPLDKTLYLTGRIQPQGEGRAEALPMRGMPDVVFRQGEPVEGLTVIDSVKEMKAGDVVIKGANALDYAAGVVGILVGDPMGGTVGATFPPAAARKCKFIVPVGLEKQVSGDLFEARRLVTALGGSAQGADLTTVMPIVPDEIITEIEALALLTGVQATQLAAGGIDGAEGAVWLVVSGEEDCVARARELIDTVQGEPPFTEAPRPKPSGK